jgi:hypothetical protein
MPIIRSPPKVINMSYTNWSDTDTVYSMRTYNLFLEPGKTTLKNCLICFIVDEFYVIQKFSLDDFSGNLYVSLLCAV